MKRFKSKKLEQRIYAIITATACAPFVLGAGEPKAGEAPPTLRLDRKTRAIEVLVVKVADRLAKELVNQAPK
jgi:hypothetical protein